MFYKISGRIFSYKLNFKRGSPSESVASPPEASMSACAYREQQVVARALEDEGWMTGDGKEGKEGEKWQVTLTWLKRERKIGCCDRTRRAMRIEKTEMK